MIDEFEDFIPRGYEDDDDFDRKRNKQFFQPIVLSFSSVDTNISKAHLKLNKYKVLPANDKFMKDGKPYISFQRDNDNNCSNNSDHIELNNNESIPFSINITIPCEYEGTLRRFVVFEFEISEIINVLSSRKTIICLGIQILGTVKQTSISKNIDSLSLIPPNDPNNSLSIEAKPYIPISSITFFDRPVNNCILTLMISSYYYCYIIL